MADAEETKSQEKADASVVSKADTTADASTSVILSGAEKQTDGQTHFGVAVMVSSDGKPSTLMIPDVAGVATGEPVFITKPIRINGKNLKAFLKNKGVELPDAINNLIEDTQISCEAFYYTKNGPLLMMFALKFEEGLIASLTGDEDLGKLFDLKGAALRVIRCDEKNFNILKQYAAGLE